MSLNLSVPATCGTQQALPATAGTPLFIVGPNGVGKSGLMQLLFARNATSAVRIAAHRINTFIDNRVPFSPSQRESNRQTMLNQDTLATSRYSEWDAANRSSHVLADLIDADNALARLVRDKVAAGKLTEAQALTDDLPPLARISELMQTSGMPITISLGEGGAVLARKNGGAPYSIAALSDGERSSLIIAGHVITAPAGALVLIDEPERHLHPSISASLLARLLELREDCLFVVSTHELSLPSSFRTSQTVIVRGSDVNVGGFQSWDLDILTPGDDLNDDLRQTILGARRTILFIEGDERSLDKPLYELLFPNVTVDARNTATEVKRLTEAMRASHTLHWARAFGIIDRDQLTPKRQEELRSSGVFSLSAYSVESLYYNTRIQVAIAEKQSSLTGDDPEKLVEAAKEAFLSAFRGSLARLSARMTEQRVKDELSAQMPDWKRISLKQPISLIADVASLLSKEESRALRLLRDGNLDEILARYPVRETEALERVAQSLNFRSRSLYEASVRKLVHETAAERLYLLSFFDALPLALAGT